MDRDAQRELKWKPNVQLIKQCCALHCSLCNLSLVISISIPCNQKVLNGKKKTNEAYVVEGTRLKQKVPIIRQRMLFGLGARKELVLPKQKNMPSDMASKSNSIGIKTLLDWNRFVWSTAKITLPFTSFKDCGKTVSTKFFCLNGFIHHREGK